MAGKHAICSGEREVRTSVNDCAIVDIYYLEGDVSFTLLKLEKVLEANGLMRQAGQVNRVRNTLYITTKRALDILRRGN